MIRQLSNLFISITFILTAISFTSCDNMLKKNAKPEEITFKEIPVTYPSTKRDTTVSDTYFGVKVADPYRWLELDNAENTKEWVKQQNIVTNGYLSQIPYREKILARLNEIWNFEKFGSPFKKADKYYFFKNDGLQNQSVLYRQDNLQAEPALLLDPNTFSKDGTSSLGELAISKDGSYMAFTISTGGSDWRNIVIKDLKTNKMLPDTIHWAKFTGLAWEKDGFYYSRFPEPSKGDELSASNQFGAVYYHKLGTAQSEDPLVFADRAHPNRFFGAETSEDEQYLLLSASETTSGNMLYFKDLANAKASFVPISDNFDSDLNFVDNVDNKLIIMTNKKAPNRRLIRVSAAQPEEEYWENLIPENTDDVLQSASLCGGKIVCQYLHNASSSLKIYSLDGKLEKEVALPEIGTVGGVSGSKNEKTAFFSFQSFLRPNTIYSLNMDSYEVKPFKAPKIAFNPDSYETEQIWYPSKDGTKIPMFVTRKKKIAMDGSNPTLLYGYGGFNISVTPSFSASRATLLENNGIYVVANIRGGGEFGEKWHKSGTKCQKQNVFDDFIGAAEYLIAKGYTKPENLAIQGGSNGGLLVGACMTQRPDLFGVCFPQVGVLDMLRYHKFTIGRAWSVDYGLSENKEEFECLLRYSPLHNIEKAAYPATMITTADHDDRVVPAHSFKYAAALQANQTAKHPTLIRIETSAGHGAGKPTKKLLEEAADMLSFMLYNMKKRVIY